MAPGNSASAAQYGINPEMNENQQPSPLSGLPAAVQQSIMQRPSYAEGQVMPRTRPGWTQYQDFDRERQLAELGQLGVPGREDQLANELAFMRNAPREAPTREGWPLTSPGRYSGGPYNLGLGNLGALY